jgi:dihydrofolate synthase/folylpolyglutamate synthase
MVEKLRAAGVAQAAIHAFDSVASAYRAACDAAADADRIIVFGSFLTVAAALDVNRASENGTTAMIDG